MNNNPKNKLSSNDVLHKPIFFRGRMVNPRRGWRTLLIIFVIFIISSVVFDFYMYKEIVSGDMYVSVKKEELTIEDLKTSDLQKIQDNFKNKEAIITTLKIENLIDPSL